MIQIKNDRFHFKETEYLESSNNEIVTLTLTSIDLELFFKQYDVYDLEYISGWKFRSIEGLFTTYVDKWTKRKIEATKEKNFGQRTLSKLMLNALYGKFSTSLEARSKIPYLQDDIVKYALRRKGIEKRIICSCTGLLLQLMQEIRQSELRKPLEIIRYQNMVLICISIRTRIPVTLYYLKKI